MISERVKKLREFLDLTQEEFAHLLGIHSSSVHRWESGKYEPEGLQKTYISVMEYLIENGKGEELKAKLKKALMVGGTLACVYALLKLYFEE